MTNNKCKTTYQIVSKKREVWDETEDKNVADHELKRLKKEYYGAGLRIKKKKC